MAGGCILLPVASTAVLTTVGFTQSGVAAGEYFTHEYSLNTID